MQNAGIYHIAARMTAYLGSCVPKGLCPWTPLGALPPDPHFLALRARFPFCRLSDQHPL